MKILKNTRRLDRPGGNLSVTRKTKTPYQLDFYKHIEAILFFGRRKTLECSYETQSRIWWLWSGSQRRR